MPIFLRMKVGDAFTDAAVLQPDRPLMIGRSAEADVAIVKDSEMSSFHATVTMSGGKCLVRDNGSTNGTFLNGKKIQEGEISSGDDLKCGSTVFRVESPAASPVTATVSSAPAATVPGKQPAAPAPPEDKDLPEALQQRQGFVSDSAAEVVTRFKIDELTNVPGDSESTLDYINRVAADREADDVVKFIGFALPRRCSVWWSVQCLRSEVSAVDEEPGMLDAVTQWVQQPTDESRRQLMQMAEEVDMATAASWTAAAVFWSHGSMAPPDLDEVPAAENMTGKAVYASIAMASFGETPAKAPERRQAFKDLALQIAAGQLPWG